MSSCCSACRCRCTPNTSLTLPFSLRRTASDDVGGEDEQPTETPRWPLWLAVGLLAVAGIAAAFVSDWFVSALEPAMDSLSVSDTFASGVPYHPTSPLDQSTARHG